MRQSGDFAGSETDPQKPHGKPPRSGYHFLHNGRSAFGFERLVYVDIHNEVPFFMKGYKQLLKDKGWVGLGQGTSVHTRAD